MAFAGGVPPRRGERHQGATPSSVMGQTLAEPQRLWACRAKISRVAANGGANKKAPRAGEIARGA